MLRRPHPLNDVSFVDEASVNPASWMRDRLLDYIKEFEDSLSEDEEIGGRLIHFGTDTIFHITSIGYHGPDLVCFYGIGVQGERLQLVQHMSQVSVLFVALPKTGAAPRRIGFRIEEKRG